MPEQRKFENIVLEGGGVLVSAYIGVFEELENRGMFQDIRNAAGTSGGAIAALCVVLGLTPQEIRKKLLSMDMSKFRDGSWFFKTGCVYNLLNKWCLYDGKVMRKFIEGILVERGISKDINFIDLYGKTNRELKIYSTNINRRIVTEFSYLSTPQVKIADALVSSSSVPGLFPPIVIEKEKYVDGGLTLNYPIKAFDAIDAEGNRIPNLKTIGINLDTEDEHDGTFVELKSAMGYLEQCITMLLGTANKVHVDTKLDWPRTVRIPTDGISALDFEIKEAKKLWLIESGKLGTAGFLDGKIQAFSAFWQGEIK